MDPSPPDAFALLELPRHPVLEEADLTRAYDAHARREEADREAVNQARAILASPAKRLKHLLQLCGHGDLCGQTVLDPELTQVFSQATEVFQSAADLQRKKKQATTALAEAMLTRQMLQVRDALGALQLRLREIESEKLEALRFLCPPGETLSLDSELARQLATWQGTLTFLERWREQARTAWMELF